MDEALPRFLILETSGRSGQVALAEGAVIVQSRRLDEARRHARDLAPAVAELFLAESWRPREIQAVLVSRGPGSYTGLRVGIMSAKTFAYATGCAVLGIDTFAAVARQAPDEVDRVDVVADAQQEKVYVQRFRRTAAAGAWVTEEALAILPFQEWIDRLLEDVWVTGPGLRGYANRLPPETLIVAEERWDPQPESLLHLGLARYERGEHDDLWSLEPLYLRPSSAEEKWQLRNN